MAAEPLADIAIVTFNTRAHWPRLAAALAAQTEPRFRLWIIDNASRPDQRLAGDEIPAGARLIQLEENIGFAAANNRAAREGAAQFFICLNPDAFPEPDWLARLIAAAEAHPGAGAVGSLQISAEDETLLDGAGDMFWAGGLPYRSLYRRPRPAALPAGEAFSACAAAALYPRAAFLEAGGFDERFFCYCEDVDLGFRLRLMGKPSLQADDAVVVHVGGGSAGGASDFARFHGARNRLWTFVKNVPAPLLFALAPVHAGVTLFMLGWSLFRGSARPTWAGVWAGLRGLPEILAARRAVQARRSASSAAIARAMVWSPWAVLQRRSVRRTAQK